jgi:PAS domain S-box-containing protein
MNLRVKSILVIALGFLFIIGLFLGYGSTFLETQYRTLEEDQVTQVSQTFYNTIKNDLQNMGRILRSYSGWNETFQYVQKAKKKAPNSTYNADYLSSNGISGMIIFNRSGEPLFNQVKKPDSDLITVFNSGQISIIQNLSLQYDLLSKRTGIQGIISLGDYDALIASEPVIINSYAGSAQGTMHFILWLDSAYLKKKSYSPDYPVRYLKSSSSYVELYPGYFSGFSDYIPEITIAPLNSTLIEGSFILRDLSQLRDYKFIITLYRSFYESGKQTIIIFGLFFILSGFIIGFIVVFFIDKVLLSRIDAIIKKIRQSLNINSKNPPGSEHMFLSAEDELDILLHVIDPVFARIVETQIELKQSEDFFYRVTETIQDGLLIFEEIEKEQKMIYHNIRLQEILGCSCSYKNIDDFLLTVVSDDFFRVKKEFKEIIHSQNKNKSIGFWIQIGGEIRKYILCRFSFIESFHGSIRILLVISDITHRKKAEELLLESEAKYRYMTENISHVHWQMSPEYVITYVSPADEVLRGYRADEVIGKTIWDFTPPYAVEKLNKSIAERQNTYKSGKRLEESTFELELLCKDGKVLWIEVVSNPIFDYNGNLTGFHGIFRDITGRKIAEEAIVQANKKINLLSSITRHDVLNQLTVIISSLELMKEEEITPYIRSLINSEENASNNIIRLIEFTRDYQDIGLLSPQWFLVRDFMQSAISNIGLTDICFRINIGELSIYADALLEKVFFNLIDNSIRHGGFVTTINIDGFMEKNGYHLIFSDDGTGIKSDEHEKIFARGYGQNTGMGLFLIREILSITGISIKENGKEGEGVRFEMIIPDGRYKI